MTSYHCSCSIIHFFPRSGRRRYNHVVHGNTVNTTLSDYHTIRFILLCATPVLLFRAVGIPRGNQSVPCLIGKDNRTDSMKDDPSLQMVMHGT